MNVMGVYGCLWVSMSAYGCLWIFMGYYGCLRVCVFIGF